MPFEFLPQLQVAGLTLREVVEADYPFLRAVYRDVRQQELAPTGWPPAVKDAFCDSQFALQDRHYRSHYPFAHFYVVERAGMPVGRFYISDDPGQLGLMEVSFLLSQRGQGMGTALMQWLAQLADQRQQTMVLHVEPNNPAKRLYERFGFCDLALSGVYMQMQRLPQPAG